MSSHRSSPAADAAPAIAEPAELAGRREIMSVCTAAKCEELGAVIATVAASLEVTDVRPVECGLVMLRGRMGGDGRAFNLGEATVTRAAVALSDGRTGFAYQLGRDREKARAAAIIDALWQGRERAAIEHALAPLRTRIADAAALAARRSAATRVNFFTMVRGEDE
jgi:alpha-D-ribose 1-methylphosphonate 5-triphosphate synthase subunit PhnG